MDLSERQQQDIMYLRRLLFRKVGQLYWERKVLLAKMLAEHDSLCHSSDKLAQMTDTAEQLRNSGAEELKTYMQFSSAFYRGVRCLVCTWTKQICSTCISQTVLGSVQG